MLDVFYTEIRINYYYYYYYIIIIPPPLQDWSTPKLGLRYPPPLPRKDLGPVTWERTWDLGTPWKTPGTSDLGKNQGLGYPTHV